MNTRTTPRGRPAPPFHVELVPVPTETPPFHALHGTVPLSPAPHLPSHLEEGVAPQARHR